MGTQVIPFDVAKATALEQLVLPHVLKQPQAEAEVSLLMAYMDIAQGVKRFPLLTKDARAELAVRRGARALCAIIEEVGALSDAQTAEALRAEQEGHHGRR